MKIGCLQFAAGQDGAGQNLARADSILLHANPEELDLLVLPELAFVGQVFDSLSGIYPHLESSGSGITSSWARAVALKYNCTVMVGYAEKADIYPKRASGPKCYNSTIAIDADGEIVAHYRKRYLQPSEENWASEGPGSFHKGWLPHLGQVAIGTSMDINPYKFQDRWDNFDFAFHVMKIQANLVVVTMAWPTHEDPRSFNRTPLEPDANTLMYWISRLEPIIRAENEKEVIVVFCNKSGSEGHACYAGTSAVLGISAGEVRVYNILGRGTHGLLVADTDSPPLGRQFAAPTHRLRKSERPKPRSSYVSGYRVLSSQAMMPFTQPSLQPKSRSIWTPKTRISLITLGLKSKEEKAGIIPQRGRLLPLPTMFAQPSLLLMQKHVEEQTYQTSA